MGLEETLALTPPSRAEANPVIFSRIATAGEGPALSPREREKHAQVPEFSRPLVWNCFLGTYVGGYANPNGPATVCIAAMTCVMCSSSGRPSNCAPFSMSSRFTAAANDFCFIFFFTLLAVMPVSFSGRT